jgi:hypothetical protein
VLLEVEVLDFSADAESFDSVLVFVPLFSASSPCLRAFDG